MVYSGHCLQQLFSGGTNRQKLITSFTQTRIASFKAMRPQKPKVKDVPWPQKSFE